MFDDEQVYQAFFKLAGEEYPYYPKRRIQHMHGALNEAIYDDNKVVTEKLDGALAHVYIRNMGPSVAQSYRVSKRTNQPIDYTPKIPGIEDTSLPSGFGSALDVKGELIISDKSGKVLPHQEISGILNSTPQNAMRKIQEKNLKPQIALFDIQGDERPYKEKLQDLQRIAEHNSSVFTTPKAAFTREEKDSLIEGIQKGKNPLTSEGIIIDGQWKVKYRKLARVYVHSFYDTVTPGSRLEGSGIGGFWYSLTRNGRPVGKVGSGFTEQMRRDLYANKGDYVGKEAIIEHQGQYPGTRAYRAPSFKGFA